MRDSDPIYNTKIVLSLDLLRNHKTSFKQGIDIMATVAINIGVAFIGKSDDMKISSNKYAIPISNSRMKAKRIIIPIICFRLNLVLGESPPALTKNVCTNVIQGSLMIR